MREARTLMCPVLCRAMVWISVGLLGSPAGGTARADWPHWRGDGGNGVSLTAKPPVEFGPDRKLRWQAEIPGRGSSSPVVVGDRVFVTTAVPGAGEPTRFDFRLLCFDRQTGRELWRCAGQTVRPCASAVAAAGKTWIGSGFRGAFLGAFDLSGRGDLAGGPQVLWTKQSGTPDVSSPLLSGGRLSYYKDKSGLLTCLDAQSGAVLYETARIPGVARTYASPVAAGGHVYLTDRSGRITVIEDGPALKVVAENDVGEGVDATPALAGDSLFIRGERHLFRFADH